MSPRRPILASILLVAALVGWPADAPAQTFPSDDAGRPAPWCSYLDTSVTPNRSVVCSTTNPLPSGPGAASIATDTLGYGRAFFFSDVSNVFAIRAPFFIDQINVLGYGTQGAARASVASSNDGGRTWAPAVDIQLGAINPPTMAGVTIGTTPRYVLAATGLATALDIFTSSSPSGGFVAATGGAGRNATSPVTFAIQGATVMAWAQGGGGNNTAIACRSQDNGQTFAACVTADAGLNTAFTGSGPQATITSPAVNTWLAVTNNGLVKRSINDGAAWATVLTLPSGTPAAVKCVSATVCLVVDSGANTVQPYRSIDGGATWTAQALIGTLAAANSTGAAFCVYSADVVDVIIRNNYPLTTTTTTTPAFRSTDGGQSWVAVPVTGGQAAFVNPMDTLSDCAATSTGRSVFVGQRLLVHGFYYGPVTTNTVQIVGANGIPLDVDANGNFTGNQGLPQATSPNAWGVVPVQGPALFNSEVVSAANAAVSVVVAAVASQRVHLRRVDARCSAGTATLTVTDGATVIWSSIGAEVAAARFTQQWQPSVDTTTSAALTVTLGACGAANTGTLTVQADRF